MPTDFSNSFNTTFFSKFITNSPIKIPPNYRHVTCEIFVILTNRFHFVQPCILLRNYRACYNSFSAQSAPTKHHATHAVQSHCSVPLIYINHIIILDNCKMCRVRRETINYESFKQTYRQVSQNDDPVLMLDTGIKGEMLF